MKNRLIFAVCSGFLLLCGGCFLFQNRYEEPLFYDLGRVGTPEKVPCQLTCSSFRNLSGADRRFLVRVSENRLVNDEYNRWLVSPELMLERFFRESFISGSGDPVKVQAVLTGFEIDRKGGHALLAMDFTLRKGGKVRRFSSRVSETFPRSGKADEPVLAMKRCAVKAVGELKKNIMLLAAEK